MASPYTTRTCGSPVPPWPACHAELRWRGVVGWCLCLCSGHVRWEAARAPTSSSTNPSSAHATSFISTSFPFIHSIPSLRCAAPLRSPSSSSFLSVSTQKERTQGIKRIIQPQTHTSQSQQASNAIQPCSVPPLYKTPCPAKPSAIHPLPPFHLHLLCLRDHQLAAILLQRSPTLADSSCLLGTAAHRRHCAASFPATSALPDNAVSFCLKQRTMPTAQLPALSGGIL
jgi:hypothetical protein